MIPIAKPLLGNDEVQAVTDVIMSGIIAEVPQVADFEQSFADHIGVEHAIAGKDIHSQDDHASIMLKFNGDKAGVVETNWLTPHKVRKMTVIGINGVAYLDCNEQTVLIHDGEWTREAKIETTEPLKRELEHFVDAVRTGDNPIVAGKDGKHALEVAQAAIESYKSGQIVRMD